MIVTGDPYDFPITGVLEPQRTALLIIDMQRDFCDPAGYMHSRGDDVAAARAIVPRILGVLEIARRTGMLVIYTREGHRANLADLPASKRLKTARAGAQIGATGPLGRLLIRRSLPCNRLARCFAQQTDRECGSDRGYHWCLCQLDRQGSYGSGLQRAGA